MLMRKTGHNLLADMLFNAFCFNPYDLNILEFAVYHHKTILLNYWASLYKQKCTLRNESSFTYWQLQNKLFTKQNYQINLLL